MNSSTGANKLCDTLFPGDDGASLMIIDQTLLPGEIVLRRLATLYDFFEAISLLRVRGAPAIGVSAAYGLAIAASNYDTDNLDSFFERLQQDAEYLNSSRPTAVNLSWALKRLVRVAQKCSSFSVAEVKLTLMEEADRIRREDIEMCRRIGEHGLTLLRDGMGILTHCNAGQLATVRYGTALAPLHLGKSRGMSFNVYADETRPLLQGARLTAFELTADDIPTTVICDNMAASLMAAGKINAVIVGADRIAANGDVCNKIGTSAVAILASHYGIPFYVAAPGSTFDLSTATGDGIIIEQRNPAEVSSLFFKSAVTPCDAQIYNPAFDVTDHTLVTAIIYENGVLRPPYDLTKH